MRRLLFDADGTLFDYDQAEKRALKSTFARMNQPPRATVLIIGDSLTSDIQGGLNYGIDTCWFNPVGKRDANSSIVPTYEIRQLGDLPKLLGGNQPE